VNWPFKKVQILFSADHLLDKTFQMMYSNLGLSFRWTLSLSFSAILVQLGASLVPSCRYPIPIQIKDVVKLYDENQMQKICS